MSNNERIGARANQDRGWAAPMPNFSQIRNNESARVRVEWDTRDTVNNRLYSDMLTMGPKTVTTAMLASHPTQGAEPFMPTVSRKDENMYQGLSYFPNSEIQPSASGRRERARLPPPGLAQNPYTAALDTDTEYVRELRQSVVEDNRYNKDDTDARIMDRVFTHQLITAEMTKSIVERQLEAAETLRPKTDSWLRPV